MSMVTLEEIRTATKRIHEVISPSPLTYSPTVSDLVQHDVYFKWDNKLRVGSFKERGAINVMMSLNDIEKKRGVCAASAGNHALAISTYAAKFGVACTIIMPVTAPLVKIQSTQKTGAKVLLQGTTFDEAYEQAQKLSAEKGYIFLSAFDDNKIVAGQGSAGIEIMEQLPDLDSIILPIGGGGLISGVATAVKSIKPSVYVAGIQSDWVLERRKNPELYSNNKIRWVSIADGIAVKRVGKITQPIIDRYVDKIGSISEQKIASAILQFLELERSVVEGAGAAALGGLVDGILPKDRKKTVVFVSGSNIDANLLSRLIEREMLERHRLLRLNVSVPDRPGSLHATSGIIAECGANVVEVFHDRHYSTLPGDVEITFLLEVRDADHKQRILAALKTAGLPVKIL